MTKYSSILLHGYFLHELLPPDNPSVHPAIQFKKDDNKLFALRHSTCLHNFPFPQPRTVDIKKDYTQREIQGPSVPSSLFAPNRFLDNELSSMFRTRSRIHERTVIARNSVTFSTSHSFISVKNFFDEHVYLTQTRMTLVLG